MTATDEHELPTTATLDKFRATLFHAARGVMTYEKSLADLAGAGGDVVPEDLRDIDTIRQHVFESLNAFRSLDLVSATRPSRGDVTAWVAAIDSDSQQLADACH
jgi:hypothetical protein